VNDREITAQLLELTAAVRAALDADALQVAVTLLDRREPLLRQLAEMPAVSLSHAARGDLVRVREMDAELLERLQPALAEIGTALARLGACHPSAPPLAAQCIDSTA
jgi:hypothetical protein